MNSVTISMVIVPGVVALLLFLVFTYLYEQSRQHYFRAWQLGWAAYTLHYALDAWSAFRQPSALVSLLASLLLVAMALCIFVSTRLMRERFRLRWYDVALGAAGAALAYENLRAHMADGMFRPEILPNPNLRLEVGLALVLLYCSAYFYRYAHRKNSLAFKLLAMALALWAVPMAIGPFRNSYVALFDLLGPIPQMLLGIAMVMVLSENERNAVQENALAFSTLGVDPTRLLSPEDLIPTMQNILDRLVAPLPRGRAVICVSERWRAILPSVRRGFSPEFVNKLEKSGAGEYVCELAYRRGGFVTFDNVPEMSEPLPAFPGGRFEQIRQVLTEENIYKLTAVSLQTREHNFGVILFPHAERRMFGSSNLRLLIGLALQIGLTLEKTRERLGVTFVPGRPAKCFCGAPILLGGKPAGVMAAMNTEREYVFEERDLEVMQTAAGQVSVAVENARLFTEEQRRARQFAFLNNISKTAISSEDAEQMLAEIVSHIQKDFRFDHIGIGILDYVTKDIEIKAEAGATAQALGKRIPLGVGILGRVARTGESALVQTTGEGHLQGVLPESRAVLCIPISYGETLLGVLNVESRNEDAFTPQDVLVMNTLADLLATALHNAFVFQKLQQQSITDGLTGIKTRRFFWEALTSEWKRASRSGRPFSVVLMDLDKFKAVNDTLGHLEGDLVLARVGRLLEQKCRQSNVVARYGGDEFIILMPETGVEQAQILAERLRLWIAQDAMLKEHQITGSFGVGSFPVHGFSVEDIIRVADAGMYVSKHAGGDRVSTAEEFAEGETAAMQRQLISGYIEGFLQREHTGPEHLEELITTLKKLGGDEEDGDDANVLRESIEALTHAAKSRELNSSGHGDMVARYCEVVARSLGLPAEEVADLTYAARIHDVGKIFVPEQTLNKSGPLTEDEFYLLKMHAHVGAEIMAAVPGSEKLQKAVEHHHEAVDGVGYPAGLRGEQIPLWSRIMAIADAYANMTTERSFAAAKSSEQALAELERLSGTRYDGMLVRILIRELKAEKASSSLGT